MLEHLRAREGESARGEREGEGAGEDKYSMRWRATTEEEEEEEEEEEDQTWLLESSLGEEEDFLVRMRSRRRRAH